MAGQLADARCRTIEREAEQLAAAGVTISFRFVGNLFTSLEMMGASITLMHLDDELQSLLDHPCDCAMFQVAAR